MTVRERRRQERMDREDLPISLYVGGEEVRDPDLGLRDLSSGGLGIQAAGRMEVGQRVSFRLVLPTGPVGGTGQVRWAAPHHLGYRYGLEIRGMGLMDGRRYRSFVDPTAFDWVGLVDTALKAATVAMIVLLFWSSLGLPVAGFGEILNFVLRR